MSDLTEQKVYARLVPAAMRIELFKRVHGHEAGHFGYAKIYPLFSERFFWHGMSLDIRNWLKCCALCQRIKPGDGRARYALVQDCAVAPMKRCGINLSLSKEGNQYLSALQDYLTKWIEVYAMPDKKALSVAKCLVKFMARYGRVVRLHLDLGMEFQASVSKHLYELWGVHNCYNAVHAMV